MHNIHYFSITLPTPARGFTSHITSASGRLRARVTLLAAVALVCLSAGVVAQTPLGADIDGEGANDNSGLAVSVSADGNRVAIGAPFNSGSGGLLSGQVRVVQWLDPNWVQVGDDIDGEALFNFSGLAVSLSADGGRVAIGAPLNSGSAGQVRVYQWSDPNWVQVGVDIDGETGGDLSGNSVSLSADGSRVAIGAPFNGISGTQSGQVRVYQWLDSSWVQIGDDIDGEAPGDLSGLALSLSADGSRVAIGAPFNAGSSGYSTGQVRVYEWLDSSWEQIGDDLDGEALADQSGNSVSLSADGSRVAIGAPLNDANGEDSGQVRVYQWSDPNWVQVDGAVNGAAAADQFGFSVALSADGGRVATGAPFNDDTDTDSGQVRVFTLTTATPEGMVADIAETIVALAQEGDLTSGIANALLAKLDATLAAITVGDIPTACATLQAFINSVKAQSGKKISAENAASFISQAQATKDLLGCD